MSNEEKIISSHIFIFPFKWDYINKNNFINESIDKRIDLDKFKGLLGNNGWEEDNSNLDDDSGYNQYAYFYENVRHAIYNKNKDEVKNHNIICYKYKNINAVDTYNIKLSTGKEYSLRLKDIKLKIYRTGVGSLSYFVENYDYKLEEDILKINDFGRRIYPQYLPLDKCQNNFLAEELILKFNNAEAIGKKFNDKQRTIQIAEIVKGVFGKNFVFEKDEIKEKKIYIEPIIDDRMFTMCIYRSNKLSDELKQSPEEYFKSDFWYKYIFVDNNNITCQDEEMTSKLLKESTYTRWRNMGTLYGISRYSFVMLKEESEESDNEDYLLTHFRTMYYEMTLLALTQRASILRFSNEASQVSGQSDGQALKNIKELQRHYIQFINKIYFREVTAQEQGIELYNKLLEMMKIERDVKRLDDEIDEIHKYTSLVSTGFTNNLLRLITYITASITISNFVSGLYKISKQESLNFIPTYRLAIITIAIVIVIIKIVEQLLKYNKKKLVLFVVAIGLIISYIIPILMVDNHLWRLVPWLN
jgi:hypothetical protein